MTNRKLLLICGSLRVGSSNAALLQTVQEILLEGVVADLYDGLAKLPHFSPDDDSEDKPVPPAVGDLRERIRVADALLFSTPEYAGGLPGAFKNLLDWTVGGGEMYGKSVAWLNASAPASPTGGAEAHISLRKVLGYVGAEIVEDACVRIPVVCQAIGADGRVYDPSLRKTLLLSVDTLLAYTGLNRP